MTKKVVVVIGGGKPPRQVDISTPLPAPKILPGPLPPMTGKPFVEQLAETFGPVEAEFLKEMKVGLGSRQIEGNDAIRKRMGHDFPGASLDGSYCRRCGCGTSFAPTTADPDFQPCPGGRA